MKTYYKQTSHNKQLNNKHECFKHCKKDKNADVAHYDMSNGMCQCLEQKKHKHEADDIFKEIGNKTYKVNSVAFWVTFSFFMLFMLVLIYFFIQIFFIRSK